jgi:F-type H+-transporting ATPase subunit b
VVLLIVLRSFAWKPILNAIKVREDSIRSALMAAENANVEMQKLKADNEIILNEAKIERDVMMKDAREVKDKIIAEAKDRAALESKKLLEQARISIQNEKESAIGEIKKQVAILSVEIAEKILREQLAEDENRKEFMDRILDEIKLN